MTNEDKAREIAHNCCSHIMGGELSDETCFTTEPNCCKAAMEMAEWKDEHPSAEMFRYCIQMLNSACYEDGTGVDEIDIEYAIKQNKLV